MSKVTAYVCDFGDHLMAEESIMGINPIEDLFDKISSYPSILAHKTDVHVCTECYKRVVLIQAQNSTDRKNNESGYKAKIKELGYGFRAQAVHNHRLKTMNKKGRKK